MMQTTKISNNMAHEKQFSRLIVEHVVSIAAIAEGMAVEETRKAIQESVKAICGEYEFRHVVEVLEIGKFNAHAERYRGTEAFVVLHHLHDALVNLKRIEQILDR